MQALLYKYGDFDDPNAESLIALFLVFYINGCPAGGSPEGFVESITEVLTVLDTAVDFVNNIVTDEIVTAICGDDPIDFVTGGSTNSFETALCGLGELLVEVQRFFSCEKWRPLYRIVMYDSVCYSSSEGLYYVAITQFCIVVFAMLMLTLRVAFSEVEYDENGTANDLDNAAIAMADERPPPEDHINVAAHAAYDDDDDENNHKNWTTTPAPQY